MIHNPQHYARDFYFFKRAQYPQLSLVHKKPAQAFMDLQKQCFLLKFVEIGKVMLTWGILKNVNHVVQRVVFLHEDLMKLPSFPRKALEAELDLYVNGEIGKVSRMETFFFFPKRRPKFWSFFSRNFWALMFCTSLTGFV